MPEETRDAQFRLNLKTVYLSCNVVLSVMEKQGSGSVTSNVSIVDMGYLGKPQVSYASAKAAVIHFPKITGVMYANKGVRVNSVSPGMAFMPLLENWAVVNRPKCERYARRSRIIMFQLGLWGIHSTLLTASHSSQVGRLAMFSVKTW